MGVMNGKNLFDVSGKVVLVTGAGSGLGKGYAQTFGEAGSTVICAGRNMERAGADGPGHPGWAAERPGPIPWT